MRTREEIEKQIEESPRLNWVMVELLLDIRDLLLKRK